MTNRVGATDSAREQWGFLGRRLLVVSPFPPKPDGIARYTEQLLRALPDRRCRRLGIPGGGGDHVLLLSGGLRPLRILRHARGADDVLVMYHQTYFHHFGFGSRLASYLSLWLVSRACPVTFVIHEPDDALPAEVGRRGKLEYRILEVIRRQLWGGVRRLVFHTAFEQRRFAARFPPRGREERIVEHGAAFVPAVATTREQARAQLALPADRAIALMIGFLSPHKRYDRVIDAFAAAAPESCELHIVGSPITDWPEVMAHVEALRRAVRAAPRVHLSERFLDDGEFDLWLRAADAVIVPYATASSSGVVERAHLFGTPLITTGAGGIAEQLHPGDRVYGSDGELIAALEAMAAGRSAAAGA
jgi:glycosyltransferase involved in cell wall biosynthesis